MTPMLRLLRQDLPLPEVSLSIESPVPGVVLVDAVLDRHEAPLHWRAGLWDKPPLDVSLRPDGRLVGVQFVLQDEKVPRGDGPPPSSGESGGGWPVFEVRSWPEKRYVDEKIAVSFERAAASLVLGIGSEPVGRWVRAGTALSVGLNASDEVVGMVFGPLDAENWNAIDAFSSIA